MTYESDKLIDKIGVEHLSSSGTLFQILILGTWNEVIPFSIFRELH